MTQPSMKGEYQERRVLTFQYNVEDQEEQLEGFTEVKFNSESNKTFFTSNNFFKILFLKTYHLLHPTILLFLITNEQISSTNLHN